MSDISRRSSRQPLVPADDANSLTSFPDPAESTSPGLPPQKNGTPPPPQLNGLLDVTGPSMFDEQDGHAGPPTTLSTAPSEVVESVMAHRGSVELVRHLSALLAERDAHVTALIRLAEEFRIPADRIADTADRVKQAERRRLSLAAASVDLPPITRSASSVSVAGRSFSSDVNGTVRGLTKLFGGTGKRRSIVPSIDSARDDESLRSTSRPPPAKDRHRSLDVTSVTSTESTGWAASLFSGGTIKASLSGTVKKRDSRPTREPVEMSTRHDPDRLPPTLSQPTKDPQEAEWNKFLVKLTRAREQAGVDADSGELIGASRFGNEGASGRQKLESLTRLVVGGVPMNLRHPIWMELSNTYAIMRPDAYQYYLHLPPEDDDPSEMDAILKDVPRTLTSKYDFYADKGYDRLKRVLVAFVSKYPGLGYTQGLNMIAGYLLLAIPDESDAFWVLCNMVDAYFPRHYFSRAGALAAPIADNVVLRQYVRELLPRLADQMDAYDVDAEHTVPLSWFLTAFASVLPEPALLRIWDVWLCLPQHRAFLFNVALALLACHAKGFAACASQGEFFAYMSNKCRVAEDPDQVNDFIRQAFVLRKKLEQVEIRRALAMRTLRTRGSTEALYTPEPEPEPESHSA